MFTHALFMVHFMSNVGYMFYIKRLVRLDKILKM